MSDSVDCPVCFETPSGEVHQCNNGHTYCLSCWRNFQPRRCPECRIPLADNNRSRAQEQRIAVLPAICPHCDLATTRGGLAAHVVSCEKKPVVCAAAKSGCIWTGIVSEQAAHQASCLRCITEQLVKPLNDEIERLREVIILKDTTLEDMNRRVRRLEQVRPREADDSPAFERRVRQHAAPDDTSIQQMTVGPAVDALQIHVEDGRVAATACSRLERLCVDDANRQPATDAGAIEAALPGMRAHFGDANVLDKACRLLRNVTCPDDSAGGNRKQRAADSGAIEVVVAAMLRHPQEANVQHQGSAALRNICASVDDAAATRKQRAFNVGAIRVVITAMRNHPADPNVQEQGSWALRDMCTGTDAAVIRRVAAAVSAGARDVIGAAMSAYPRNLRVRHYGQQMLDVVLA